MPTPIKIRKNTVQINYKLLNDMQNINKKHILINNTKDYRPQNIQSTNKINTFRSLKFKIKKVPSAFCIFFSLLITHESLLT